MTVSAYAVSHETDSSNGGLVNVKCAIWEFPYVVIFEGLTIDSKLGPLQRRLHNHN